MMQQNSGVTKETLLGFPTTFKFTFYCSVCVHMYVDTRVDVYAHVYTCG